jgi:DNA repair exonuclease SbcCD ATPase subunit
MQKDKELREELADLAVKTARVEKKLKRLRRPPAGPTRGRQTTSFFTARESMAEAEELSRQLGALRQRESEIRAKLKKPDR